MASVAVGISCMGPLGVEQGHIGPILAVPLNLHLTPLGHCGLNLDALMYFVIKQLPYDIMYNMCCVEKINDLSFFFLSVVLLFFFNQSRISTALQIIHNKVYQK
jgi:hypothetical protein